MTELLPCPFCGGEARIFELTWTDGLGVPHDFKHPYYRVVCQGGCRTLKGDYDTEAKAIAAWNSRAERTCECVAEYAKSPFDGKTIVLHRCSACHELMRPHMAYCPNCGREVKQ